MEVNMREKIEKSYFDVLGLCCSSEVPIIEKILNSLDGIKDFSVVVPTKTVIVVHDSLLLSHLQIAKALNAAGMEANVRVSGYANYKNKWPSLYGVASGLFLILSFLKYFYSPLKWLALVAVAVGILPVIRKAYIALRNFNLDINILVLITVAGSIALGDYWEAATIVFLFTISEWLESRASHKATAVMSSLVSVVPQKAILAESGEEINADEVKLNTLLAVKAGEVIPIDGVVVEGDCEVDEKILTGESFPVTKQKDSTVWASTINLNGYICMRTTAMAEDCAVARMAKIVEEAQSKKSTTQRLLDKCAKYYTPGIVVISGCLAVVPLAFHVGDKKQWYHLALVVLVSGCPCALLLSTPVAMFCALSKAATIGVLFKGAQHFETLAKIKIMAFDKTGTITRGEFVVADFKCLRDDISLEDLLYWISSIECKSGHPMAAALVDYARGNEVEPKPDKVENFQNFPGEGISGRFGDTELYIGNLKIASRAGCTAPVPKIEGLDTDGKSVGYVFLGSSPVVVFCLSDMCRTGAKEAIQELKSMGIKTVMLTGDCLGAAKRAQEQLGGALEEIRAGLLPEDKASVIKELQKEGPTAMIGDGLNDAPALATADIGISMGVSGSALATESGDIVLMSNDIQRIAKALRIAKKVRRKIIENVILSISTKAAIVGLAIAGHPLVWAAVLADVGTCLLVILNSMLLLRGTSRGKKCCKSEKNKCKLQSCSDKKCASSGNKKCSDSGPAHSHKDHQCCSKDEQDLESQIPHNHGNGKHSSCKEEHGHKGHSHSHSEKTKKGQQCCSKDEQDLESHKSHKHGNKKHSSCKQEHGHNGHSHSHSEKTKKDNKCCSKDEQDLESQRLHDHGNGKHSSCKEEQDHKGHFHSHSEKMKKENQCCSKDEQDLESQRLHDHGNGKHSSCKEEHGHKGHFHSHSEKMKKDNQCCSKDEQDLESQRSHCMEEHGHDSHFHSHIEKTEKDHQHCSKVDHSLGSKRLDGCDETVKHEHYNHSTSCKVSSPVDEADNHCHSGMTVDSHVGKCCEKTSSEHQHCNSGGTLGCKDSTECSAVCTASKKAQRGCCESFRRECCIRNGNLESNFRGGLSEIVID